MQAAPAQMPATMIVHGQTYDYYNTRELSTPLFSNAAYHRVALSCCGVLLGLGPSADDADALTLLARNHGECLRGAPCADTVLAMLDCTQAGDLLHALHREASAAAEQVLAEQLGTDARLRELRAQLRALRGQCGSGKRARCNSR